MSFKKLFMLFNNLIMSFSLFYIFFSLFLSLFTVPLLSTRLNDTTKYWKNETKLYIFWLFYGYFPYQNSIFHPYFPTFSSPFCPSQTNFLLFNFPFWPPRPSIYLLLLPYSLIDTTIYTTQAQLEISLSVARSYQIWPTLQNQF